MPEVCGLTLTKLLGHPYVTESLTVEKGKELESKFILLLVSNGYDARPSDSFRKWDIEIFLPHTIARIQVKRGGVNKGRWQHNLKAKGNGKYAPYQRSDFDFLGFDGPDGSLYLVPINEIHASRQNLHSLPIGTTNLHERYSDYLIYAPN